MIEIEWNELVVDDRVVVHRHRAGEATQLFWASVASVQPHTPANDVGIRIDDSPDEVCWPSRLEVHAATDHARLLCPWCSRAGTGFAPWTSPPSSGERHPR